jgi:hypothetical protein
MAPSTTSSSSSLPLLYPDSTLSAPPKSVSSLLSLTSKSHTLESATAQYRAHILQGTSLIIAFCEINKTYLTISSTACSIFHRLYASSSITVIDVWSSAMAALFLSSKIEEHPLNPRDIVLCFHGLYQDRAKIKPKESMSMLLTGAMYARWRGVIFDLEATLLAGTGYALYSLAKHIPQRFVLYYIKMLGIQPDDDGDGFVAQVWGFCNDALRLDILGRYPPELVAVSAIHLADTRSIIRRNKQHRLPLKWYSQFLVEDTSEELAQPLDVRRSGRRGEQAMVDVCNAILSIYARAGEGGCDGDKEGLFGMVASVCVEGSPIYLDGFGQY